MNNYLNIEILNESDEDNEVTARAAKKPRGSRTTRSQHEIYINFCTENPDVLDSLSVGYKNLWITLCELLNNDAGPSKSIKKWQENLKGWEYQLKSKKRAEIVHIAGTGGGEPIKKLNEFEDRALQTFGKVTVIGDTQTSCIGLNSESQLLLPSQSSTPTSSSSTQIPSSSTQIPSSRDRRPRGIDVALTQLTNNVRDMIEKKEQRDSENFLKVADSLEKVGSGMEKIGTAMMAFAKQFEKKN